MVGNGTLDDAAVTRWPGSDRLMIQTIDVITPVVDDPYVFGQIAANNALSDVYAMGGQPRFAVAFASFPKALDLGVARRILAGGAAMVQAAGAIIVGGHTMADDIPKYGLAVIGEVTEGALRTNAGGQVGDVLLLTKPLGGGLAYSAYRAGTLSPRAEAAWIASMTASNADAARICAPIAHAMTDVTGFGLLGHGVQLAKASGVSLAFRRGALPVLPDMRLAATWAGFKGGALRNLTYAAPRLARHGDSRLVVDPQTAGGLLIAVPPEAEAAVHAEMSAANLPVWTVGQLEAGPAGRVRWIEP